MSDNDTHDTGSDDRHGESSTPADTVAAHAEPEPTPLEHPAEGVPPVETSADDFAHTADALAHGSGPVALDTERASGFRYSPRAYLVQIRRAGAGSHLIDPIEHPDALRPLAEALDGPEWVLHAADQDLPSLRELGLHCASLFDTELGGRLLNLPKVNLATMVAHFLGLGLAKGHGAADWSTRPLPDDWLNYAALDVEVLVELRDAVAAALEENGKLDWAREEFEYVRTKPAPPPRQDRWLRTSGIHKIKNPRQLAIIKSLWETREAMAQRRDIAPGRVLPDSAIIAAAVSDVASPQELTRLPVFGGSRQRRSAGEWYAAIARARALPDSQLPRRRHTGAIPPTSRWESRNPEAAQRYSRVRPTLVQIAEDVEVPVENLLAPDTVRGLCWRGVEGPLTVEAVDSALAAAHARNWQRTLTVEPITDALSD